METRKFVNGFTNWVETHHEIVDYLTRTRFTEGSMSYERDQAQGTGGLWELGEDLTNEFEKKYEGKDWDGEFYDTIEEFLNEKENATASQVSR